MAEPKKLDEKPGAPATEAPTADPILQQGAVPEPPKAETSLAGKYRVVHGTVSFGADRKAFTGALLNLSHEDAGPMLSAGVIEPAK